MSDDDTPADEPDVAKRSDGCQPYDDNEMACFGNGFCNEMAVCVCDRGYSGSDCGVYRPQITEIRNDCMNLTSAQSGACYSATHNGPCSAHKLVWKQLCHRQCMALQGQVCTATNRVQLCARAPECSPLCHDLFDVTCEHLIEHATANPYIKSSPINSRQKKPLPWYMTSNPMAAATKGLMDAVEAEADEIERDEAEAKRVKEMAAAADDAEEHEHDFGCMEKEFSHCNDNCEWTGSSKFSGSCVPRADLQLSRAAAAASNSGLLADERAERIGEQTIISPSRQATDALARIQDAAAAAAESQKSQA